jgi:multidrug resistance efflux pump
VLTARKDLADADHDVDEYNGLAEKGSATAEVARKAAVRRDIARDTLARVEAARASAEVQKTYAAIISPVEGVVVIRHKHSGDLATAGTPILTIESRQLLLFKIFVAESNLRRTSQDMPVSVKIDALDTAVEGRVRRIVPSGDPQTRRFDATEVRAKD